tara:strand:+ start:2015 stop:3115 length:1101 start_codon:yes stop_codon:yes gene_type:complete
LKISIGSKIHDGPYGGGNEFIKNLTEYLKINKYQVVNDLKDKDIDIILLTSPLVTSETSTFTNYEIDYYINFVNPNAIVFQRINECDQRKNTNYVNKTIIKRNKHVDINIFVSNWLKNIFRESGLNKKNNFVIKGGPNKNIFNIENKIFWDSKDPIKIVTHHWSSNYMKGFEEYLYLDSLIKSKNLQNEIEFTYIGNLSKKNIFQTANVIPPLYGKELADELRKHDLYITGSKNEPSGNHHMEGALCGLPILYINSGALPEYCNRYGLEFSKDNLIEKIELIKRDYSKYTQKLTDYPFTFENAGYEFIKLFNESLTNKDEILKNREKQNKIIVLINLIIFKIKKNLYKIYKNTRIKLGILKSYKSK